MIIFINSEICDEYKQKQQSYLWFHGVTASTLDFESSNPSSNLGGTYEISLLEIACKWLKKYNEELQITSKISIVIVK
ncbi:hypothetical protein T4D_1980 [Trichinella pseudospiralis]|uniref:Uncharacterized protein n=1 Tax=Trichinella pseudospiralis TaxID=6337 RepID=A0A0V1FYD2_TRIPS|nr:hypothetical protein T4D_1980 [Trichinella pseudospiralis]